MSIVPLPERQEKCLDELWSIVIHLMPSVFDSTCQIIGRKLIREYRNHYGEPGLGCMKTTDLANSLNLRRAELVQKCTVLQQHGLLMFSEARIADMSAKSEALASVLAIVGQKSSVASSDAPSPSGFMPHYKPQNKEYQWWVDPTHLMKILRFRVARMLEELDKRAKRDDGAEYRCTAESVDECPRIALIVDHHEIQFCRDPITRQFVCQTCKRPMKSIPKANNNIVEETAAMKAKLNTAFAPLLQKLKELGDLLQEEEESRKEKQLIAEAKARPLKRPFGRAASSQSPSSNLAAVSTSGTSASSLRRAKAAAERAAQAAKTTITVSMHGPAAGGGANATAASSTSAANKPKAALPFLPAARVHIKSQAHESNSTISAMDTSSLSSSTVASSKSALDIPTAVIQGEEYNDLLKMLEASAESEISSSSLAAATTSLFDDDQFGSSSSSSSLSSSSAAAASSSSEMLSLPSLLSMDSASPSASSAASDDPLLSVGGQLKRYSEINQDDLELMNEDEFMIYQNLMD